MDCSVQPTRHRGVFLVSTTDFFYPNVDDPYVQGKIACANVLSDLYAMGVADCDTILMLLASSLDMAVEERSIVTKEMIRGFNDCATLGETKVTGGQTVKNPWPIVGGVAMSVCEESEFIRPENAVAGDVLVLTKPLGTQVAVNCFQWWTLQNERWDKVSSIITPDMVLVAFDKAKTSMSRLNRNGAKLMHTHHAHACTDVTGFGILGHADNLAKNQTSSVTFEIHTLPVIANMPAINNVANFGLKAGVSAETSGGLLIAMTEADARAYIDDIKLIDGCPAWIVGRVVHGPKEAVMAEELEIIEV